jgi:hypothetical protein
MADDAMTKLCVEAQFQVNHHIGTYTRPASVTSVHGQPAGRSARAAAKLCHSCSAPMAAAIGTTSHASPRGRPSRPAIV